LFSNLPSMDESHIRSRLREWILEHAKAASRDELNDQTRILENGLLSSLDIVEFVLFIEELRGEEIDTDDIEPEVFTSVDTLWAGFFGGKGDDDRGDKAGARA
jgi:acyl carrier protein